MFFCVKGKYVIALYAYDSGKISFVSDEILEVIEKTNADWWLIKKMNGQEDHAPANYLKEVFFEKEKTAPEVFKSNEKSTKKPKSMHGGMSINVNQNVNQR